MPKKKNKKKGLSFYYIWIGLCIVVAIILLAIYFSDTNVMNRSMKEDGYITDSDDLYYHKITTGNTLDDFYNELSMNRNTAYEEYYLPKDSYSFLEQKLVYQNEVTTSLNVSSDLRNLYTIFSYELSYKEAYILMEGNSEDNYQCDIIMSKNVSQETIQNTCSTVRNELETFFAKRSEILANEKVQQLIKNAPSVVSNNNEED